MSKVICIMGESGSGKTTSMRNLDPQSTYYIDCDGKGLSWRAWRSKYNKEAKNYIATNDPERVRTLLRGIAEKCPCVHTVVVDTLNGIMVADEMRRAQEKGFDKWADLAQSVWFIVEEAGKYRGDLTVVFTAHTQTERDDSGYSFTRIQTNGRKLNKIVLESKFTTVLLAKCVDGRYLFETQAKNSTAKSPMGAFSEFEVENDVTQIIEALEEF